MASKYITAAATGHPLSALCFFELNRGLEYQLTAAYWFWRFVLNGDDSRAQRKHELPGYFTFSYS